MFVAMGVGAFAAGIFHLYTHAFFKALLFLGSGAVIHALAGEQDIRNMGGLRKKLPITYWTFMIGCLAIAGVPLLSGFFSKDEILWKTYSGGHYGIWIVAVITSLLTAIYMFRLVFLTFHGERRHDAPAAETTHHSADLAGGPVAHEPADAHHAHAAHAHDTHHGHAHGEPHDAPRAMAIPLILLAVGSIVAGYIGVPHALGGHNLIEGFLEPAFHAGAPAVAGQVDHAPEPGALSPEPEHAVAADAGDHAATAEVAHADTQTELALMGLSSAIAIAGIGIAFVLFVKRPRKANLHPAGLQKVLVNKYYIDELYDAAVVRPIHAISSAVLWKGVDARLIDGAVNGTGAVIRAGSGSLRRLQTGSVRAYAMALFAGVVAMLGYYLWRQ
jgi:NADH-quinone oxidoreductase subunit L